MLGYGRIWARKGINVSPLKVQHVHCVVYMPAIQLYVLGGAVRVRLGYG